MKLQLLLAMSLVGLLAGCAEHRDGLATGSQYNSARDKVLAADKAAAPMATDRQIVETKMITGPRVEVKPMDFAMSTRPTSAFQVYTDPFPTRPEITTTTYSEYVERWTVRRGNETAYYRVVYRPGQDNMGEIEVFPDK